MSSRKVWEGRSGKLGIESACVINYHVNFKMFCGDTSFCDCSARMDSKILCSELDWCLAVWHFFYLRWLITTFLHLQQLHSKQLKVFSSSSPNLWVLSFFSLPYSLSVIFLPSSQLSECSLPSSLPPPARSSRIVAPKRPIVSKNKSAGRKKQLAKTQVNNWMRAKEAPLIFVRGARGAVHGPERNPPVTKKLACTRKVCCIQWQPTRSSDGLCGRGNQHHPRGSLPGPSSLHGGHEVVW